MFLVKNLCFLAPVINSNNSSISTNVNNNVNNIVNNSVTKFFLCFCSVYPFCSFVFWSGRVQFLGVSVFNVCEVGFDSPTKLVSGGPRFMVDPTLRHCTFSHGLD